MLLAGILIVSRRPDVFTNAQFWAEDGKLFYADVYNRGLLATLAVPQSGYFQELQTLAAGVAQLVPLAFAPLVMNAIAVLVRVLPVGLLLSRRAETISPDVRVRAFLAALYIALPGVPEANGNIDNALWYLALAAVIVLMLRPPVRTSARLLDLTIIAMCSATGVFSIALTPIALLYRRWRGASAVPTLTLAILAAGAVIQLVAIFVLEYHLPSGFSAVPRKTVPLHATLPGFFQILGAHVIAAPLLGNSIALGATLATYLGVLATVGALLAFRDGSAELKLMIAFGGALFVMALAHPLGTSWPGLTSLANSGRYFIIPQFAAVATLVWSVGYMRHGYIRHGLCSVILAGALLYMCLITIPREWKYTPLEQTGFAKQASLFEHARPGTHVTFPLEPAKWSMTLIKH